MKLGSLFSGSGGFELAGVLCGMEPVWNSEIEPFCLRVEALRFPNCKQLGSVTDINGAEIEPVDVITFGSPCQDLSTAGAQKGIHDGERSSLFFEAIRIIKEMRHATADKFPRFAVWENVPGAFSSNGGADFAAVLAAFCGVKGNHVSVPQPARGGWKPAGLVVGDGYSIAWRVYDAQYWGVPQRRKRIYLIADFASERAGEILFESEGLSGNSEPGSEAREGASGNAERGAGGSGCVRCYSIGAMNSEGMLSDNPKAGIHLTDVSRTVSTNGGNPGSWQGGDVIVGHAFSVDCRNMYVNQEKSGTLQAKNEGGFSLNFINPVLCLNDMGGVPQCEQPCRNPESAGARTPAGCVYDCRGNGDGKTVSTLTGDHGNRVTDYTAILVCEENSNE